jgi:hypothetical protein
MGARHENVHGATGSEVWVTLEDIAHGMILKGPALVDGSSGTPTLRRYPPIAYYEVSEGSKRFYLYDRVDENDPICKFRGDDNEDVARESVRRSFTTAWRKIITGVDETSLPGRTTQQSAGQTAVTVSVKPIRSQVVLSAMKTALRSAPDSSSSAEKQSSSDQARDQIPAQTMSTLTRTTGDKGGEALGDRGTPTVVGTERLVSGRATPMVPVAPPDRTAEDTSIRVDSVRSDLLMSNT